MGSRNQVGNEVWEWGPGTRLGMRSGNVVQEPGWE